MHVDEARVNVLSDTVLYQEARQFVKAHQPPDHSQLQGLLTFSRTWRELLEYVKHQRDRFRNHDNGKQAHYGPFYQALQNYLDGNKDGLRQRLRDLQALPKGELVKQQEQQITVAWAQALAREFIQHLVAEASLQGSGARKEK